MVKMMFIRAFIEVATRRVGGARVILVDTGGSQDTCPAAGLAGRCSTTLPAAPLRCCGCTDSSGDAFL
jgi:hypothetical protein